MPSQAELKKRRVKAGKQKIRQEVVIDRRERRRRLVVGSFVALLALALIAPLVGGIFLAGDDGPPQVESITPDTPTDTAPADPDDAAADADDAISVAENFGTGSIDAGTITDVDTGNSHTCTLGGADAGDFDCTVTGTTVDV